MNNDKNIKEFLKKNDNLVVPKSITKGIDSTLYEIKKKECKKRRGKKTLIAASVATFIIAGCVYNGDAVGAAIDKAVTKMEHFLQYRLSGSNLSDYKTVIGTTVEKKGIKVTLNDFYMEDERIFINTSIDSKGIEDYAEHIEAQVYINGEKVDKSGYMEIGNPNYEEDEKDKENKVKHSMRIYSLIPGSTIDLKNAKDIKIIFDDVTATKKEYLDNPNDPNIKASDKVAYIRGNWEFSFSYNGEKVSKDIVEYKVDRSINIEHLKIHVKSVKVTPTAVTVKFKDYGGHVKGQPFFDIEDENGNIINMHLYRHSHYDDGYNENRIEMNTIGLKKIKIVPYIDKHPEKRYFEDKAVTVDLK